jgi:hypothetical protein
MFASAPFADIPFADAAAIEQDGITPGQARLIADSENMSKIMSSQKQTKIGWNQKPVRFI